MMSSDVKLLSQVNCHLLEVPQDSSFVGLPKKGFPLLFHGLIGQDQREKNSPSWFNIEEVAQVLLYITALLSGPHNLQPKDIGIISPYRKQVQKLRKALQSPADRGLTVRSTLIS